MALIGHDVATVSDVDLGAPTPCTGWTVADLIEHMNERHEAVIATVFAPLEGHVDDPRDGFARTAARWVVAMERTGDVVHLPEAGAMATDLVLSVHFVDMLTHRWDLARALGRPCTVPDRLTAAALPIARSITAPGSRLNGPGGVYHPSLAEDRALSAMDNIAALLGRDPRWHGADVPK
ncbi:maleylpyruvate isomerase family mycothiol-dependent enzyme [Nocardia pneumoniae]|uniref:maleylpyruvate isomerase family mycothiol-dependent enzyme n=1 Tax=Nocardia pneumoniae TaxID=228601 RepID=UPI001FDF6517|nr:maleylpyruvate isomerase family mycothiol-dependent enzyme [Nocardia pneumoniae]